MTERIQYQAIAIAQCLDCEWGRSGIAQGGKPPYLSSREALVHAREYHHNVFVQLETVIVFKHGEDTTQWPKPSQLTLGITIDGTENHDN
jgi:hypothetical protein